MSGSSICKLAERGFEPQVALSIAVVALLVSIPNAEDFSCVCRLVLGVFERSQIRAVSRPDRYAPDRLATLFFETLRNQQLTRLNFNVAWRPIPLGRENVKLHRDIRSSQEDTVVTLCRTAG